MKKAESPLARIGTENTQKSTLPWRKLSLPCGKALAAGLKAAVSTPPKKENPFVKGSLLPPLPLP
jgi:hypothetical protein